MDNIEESMREQLENIDDILFSDRLDELDVDDYFVNSSSIQKIDKIINYLREEPSENDRLASFEYILINEPDSKDILEENKQIIIKNYSVKFVIPILLAIREFDIAKNKKNQCTYFIKNLMVDILTYDYNFKGCKEKKPKI